MYKRQPLEGLLAQAGAAEIGCDTGCVNYKQLPLLDGPITVEYFNSTDLSGEVVARQEIAQGELMYFLDVMPGVNAWEFSARLSARVTPDADGEHHFSLASAGLSRLFVDDALLVDNWTNWQKGDTYFGFGSNAVAGAIDLQAGRATNVRVEYAYTGAGGLGMKALRIGLAPVSYTHLAAPAPGH